MTVRRTPRNRRTSNAGDTSAQRLLRAGVPLSLLLDLAAGDRLDSRAILAAEQVAELAADEAPGDGRAHSAPGVA